MASELAAHCRAVRAEVQQAGRAGEGPRKTTQRSRQRGAGSVGAVLVAGVLALTVAGCGTRPAQAGADAPNPVALSKCMRSHGVPDFPDSANGVFKVRNTKSGTMTVNGVPVRESKAQVQTAGTACRAFLGAAAKSGPPSPAQQQAALAFAACIRSHGFPAFPDPTVTAHSIRMAHPGGNASRTAKFQVAVQACQSTDPALASLANGQG